MHFCIRASVVWHGVRSSEKRDDFILIVGGEEIFVYIFFMIQGISRQPSG